MSTGLNTFVLLFVLFLFSTHAYADKVGAFGLFPLGSTRVLSMGGAFAGLSDDALAMHYNPAGMAHTRWSYDYVSSENLVINKELDLTGDNRKDGYPYSTSISALAIKVGWFSIAAGESVPYDVNLDLGGTTSQYIMRVESFDVALAVELFAGFALGVAAHNEKTNLSYNDNDNSTSGADEAQNSSVSYGLAYKKNNRAGFGISFFPERNFDIDETINSTLPWFSDIVIASKTTAGIFWNMSSKLTWVFDVDIIEVPKDTYFVGTLGKAFGLMKAKKYSIMHGGFEYKVLRTGSMDFTWRGGGYKEPARLVNNEDRLHLTMGVEFRFKAVTVSAAYDQASDFSTTAQSLNINFSKLY